MLKALNSRFDRQALLVKLTRSIEWAVNELFNPEDIQLGRLDSYCNNQIIDDSILHIHAWHTFPFWSKHQFWNGDYDGLQIDFEKAMTRTSGYCHWIATTPLEEILRCRDRIQRLYGEQP